MEAAAQVQRGAGVRNRRNTDYLGTPRKQNPLIRGNGSIRQRRVRDSRGINVSQVQLQLLSLSRHHGRQLHRPVRHMDRDHRVFVAKMLQIQLKSFPGQQVDGNRVAIECVHHENVIRLRPPLRQFALQ